MRLRHCQGSADFAAISRFLTGLYRPGNRDGNWLQPVWEYAYTHPWFDESALGEIGIWEDGGDIVGVATYELRLGEAFFHAHHDYAHLKPDMLAYAEMHLPSRDEEGRRSLKAFVPDVDGAFSEVVAARGYRLEPNSRRPMSQFVIPSPFPPISLPTGFRLTSLAEHNDLRQMSRVLHRGFNHPGEPPADAIEGCRKMQSGPNFRKDLAVVVEAPTGEFVAYCGMWFDHANRFGYVEPVATDPDYRRRGLGRAAVLEGIRRCGELGATVAYVATDMPFYLSFGFGKLFDVNCWLKGLDDSATDAVHGSQARRL